MTSSMTQEDNLKKQKGCMTGFLQILYRHQILTAKKSHTAKRLTSSTVAHISGNENSDTASSHVSKEVSELQTPKRPVPSPIFDLKEGTKTSSWKLRETSRLSLDSRATYDVEGNIQLKEIRADRLILQSNLTEDDDDNQKSRSSTSVIARLMGLEPISQAEQVEPAEPRRCSSESRFTTDLFHGRFIDENDNLSSVNKSKNNATERVDRVPKYGGESKRLNKVIMTTQKQRRSFFETEEAFPEAPQKQSISVSGEIEKKLKMRGIEEVAKDLDRLKEVLQAWQLKGLLHSKRHEDEQNIDYKHVVHDRMDPESPSYSRASPRRERDVRSPIRNRHLSLTTGSKVNERRSTSIVNQKALTIETQRRVNGSTEKSPRGSPRRIGSNQVVTNGSPRNRKKATPEIYQKEKIRTVVVPDDEFSYVCGSSLSTTSQTEGLKVMEWKEGRSLLERCDKLLKSIGEMNATEQQSQQSSPVSVLDSSSYESAVSPSPVMKRTIHFKENSDVKEEKGSGLLLSNQAGLLEDGADDCDLVYISEILRTYSYFPRDCDIFTLLEKQRCLKGKDTSNKASRLERRLIFDVINEMLERHRRLPPWKALSEVPVGKIWSEFQRIRGSENERGGDLVATVCGVVKKDLGGDEWGECSVELSAVILDIERMIFRDLVTESIGDLAILACQNSIFVAPCRRLVF